MEKDLEALNPYFKEYIDEYQKQVNADLVVLKKMAKSKKDWMESIKNKRFPGLGCD